MRRLLIALYPEAWRRRYAAEMSALLEDRPPSLGAMFDLLRGALLAHLHPLSGRPADRARNSVAGVLGCFICFCFLGSAFAKTTEDHPFQAAGRTYALLGVSHYTFLLAAIGAVAALLLAALPLAGAALGEARRTRSRELLKLITGPPLAIGLFAASVGLLALWLAHNQHDVGVIGALLLAICGLVAGIAASICWLSPRAIMRRIELQRRELALSVPAMTAVTLCMLVITVATGVYLVAILLDAPALASGGNGPWQLISTATSISIQLAGMLALSAIATLSAVRGMRSVRAL